MMKRFAIFSMVCLAATVLFSACDKDGGLDGNWWYRNDLQTGIKKIVETSSYGTVTTYEYDRVGRLISQKSDYYEEQYTYNADGLPVSIVRKTLSNGTVTSTGSTKYTYSKDNEGRFVPRQLMGTGIFHLNHVGLLPGLSKIEEDHGDGLETIVFTFNGDVMTATSTGAQDYQTFVITCQYNGAYPNTSKGDYQTMGPITYFENGMFKSYRECFLDDDNSIATERVTTYKNFKDIMNLEEKTVDTYKDGSKSTTTCTYDDHGNVIKELREYRPVDPAFNNTEYAECSYEYDSKGNWTKVSGRNVGNDGQVYNPYTTTRTIEYY